MKIEHVALWVSDLEKMKGFYQNYFGMVSGEKYINESKKFESYFLSFPTGCRIELMHKPGLQLNPNTYDSQGSGIIHLAISLGSKKKVDDLTNELREAGYEIKGEPRWTGDGYYESVVLDPENNIIELTE